MLQQQIEDRDWRYDTPFAGGSHSGALDVQAYLSPPPPTHQSRWKPAPDALSNPFESPPSPSRPTSRPASRPASRKPSLAVPPPAQPPSTRHSSKTRSLQPEREGRSKIPAAPSARTSRRPTPDPEKAGCESMPSRSLAGSHQISHHSTVIYEEDDDDDDDKRKYHTLWITIYLSTLNPLLTTALTFYAIFASLAISILSPLCLCISCQPLRTHYSRFLVPPLHLQLGLIRSNFDPEEATVARSPGMLILVHALAPFVAFGVSIATWVATAFWMFANILGNPNKDQAQQEKLEDEKNEGRAAVLGVRGWWEAWLLRGLR